MIKKATALLLIILAIYWSYSALMPNKISSLDTDDNSFSTQRALVHLKAISKQEHYLGSDAHELVRDYILKELHNLGLETQIQEGYSISKWGNLSKPKNILARIKGSQTGKALMLLSHYDSRPHASFGASDAGSGVVTILEGIRAFLSELKTPKNDIIILITDGEELGLNGADIFVNKHEWAKDVGLVLNFEARGSGGPSYMLIETNQGNANLMKAFVTANPQYPVANSLAYSIYKMLPNDTDLTRFREDGDIDGFNFAFIDDHFDYHTALDTYDRLDRNSLEHQGSYLMPLLHHFSEVNLNNLKSDNDYIYFNVPIFKTVIYPFSWIVPMLIIAIVIFLVLIFYGLKKRTIEIKNVSKGFIAFLISLVTCGLVGYFGWELLQVIYPHYNEMQQGFTYNGHSYIVAFVCLALAICFYVYHKVYKPENTASLLVAPLFFWLVICCFVAFKLKGSSFFIIPVLFGLISLLVLVKQKKPNLIMMAVLGLPVLLIMSPFVKMFPVALGLKILLVSTIMVVLIFGLLVSVFGFYRRKKRIGHVFLFISFGVLISAHFNSGFTDEQPKPNSLLYVLDADENTAIWATYDEVLDDWTRHYLSDDPDGPQPMEENTFESKYNSGFSFMKPAPVKTIPGPKVELALDTIIGDLRHISICVTAQRAIDRIGVFARSANIFKNLKINGVEAYKDSITGNVFKNPHNDRLFTYYVTDEEPLDLWFSVPKNQKTNLLLYEASYELLNNSLFTVPPRESYMIPKPFVLNDAIVVKKTITID